MSATVLNTRCAPPERLPRPDITNQNALLSGQMSSDYFNFFPLPLVIVNQERQIVFCNKTFLTTLGIDSMEDPLGKRPGEVLGCMYSDIEPGGCGTSEYCNECGALKAMLESIQTCTSTSHECQLLIKDSDGTSARDLRVFVSPWQVEDRSYYVVSIMDIEDEKRRRVLERIFFHDILNAAGGAKGLLDLLMDEVPESSREMVGLVQTALFGLVEEIKKQKELLALEANEYHISPITLQGLEIIRHIASEYRAHPVAQGKHILVEDASVNVQVYTDYTLLMRVLANMLINALEATPEGGNVRIGLDAEENHAVFRVMNDAVIPKSVQLKIFKRSFSTKGNGRGLGTYSIRLFTINYLKGEVGFESRDGQGTTFWARIPKQYPEDSCF